MEIKVSKINNIQNVIYLAKKDSDLTELKLSDKELAFAKEQVANEQKNILINKYPGIVNIVIASEEDPSKEMEALRKAAFDSCGKINTLKIKDVFILDEKNDSSRILSFAEGLALSNYQFLKYFSDKEKKQNILKQINLDKEVVKEEDVRNLEIIVDSVYIARDFVNEPLSYLTAMQFATDMTEKGKNAGLNVEVFNKNIKNVW